MERSEAVQRVRELASTIAACQTRWTTAWHCAQEELAGDSFVALVCEQHRRNFDLWHEEDKARAPDASDAVIAHVKRNIDALNQQRNDLIEKLDECLAGELQARGAQPAPDAKWNSETPGAIIDRLSILSLKIHHMREQTERGNATPEHLEKCRARLAVLEQQHGSLSAALADLLDDLFAGRKQMKLYRQFKMYNDPNLNPAIYGAKGMRDI